MIIDYLEKKISLKDLLKKYNAKISYEVMPEKINGLVFKYRGINQVIINIASNKNKQFQAIIHEMIHIELNHLDMLNNTNRCDLEAENKKYYFKLMKKYYHDLESKL